MSGIAISYRRADSSAIAGRIFDRLALRYGKSSVFMDIEDIPFGIDFRTHIRDVLLQADLLIVVIGRQWTGVNVAGGTRIRDEADAVRDEIERALARNLSIIPVLVDGATMPGKADLPDSLEPLAYLNAAEVSSGRDFNTHMDRLMMAIDTAVPAALTAPAVPAAKAMPVPGADFSDGALGASQAKSWLNGLLPYLVVPLAAYLVVWFLGYSLDLDSKYQRAAAFAVPFVPGFLLFWRSGRGPGLAFVFAVALGVLGVAGMMILDGLYSGESIMPENRAAWSENLEYVVEIAVAFMVGNVAAAVLRGLMRKKSWPAPRS